MTSMLPRLDRSLRAIVAATMLLALVGRLVSGSLVVDPRMLDDDAALQAAMIQCDPGAGDPSAGGPADRTGKRPRHAPDGALVSLAALLSLPSPVLTPVAVLPAPRSILRLGRISLPAARAPPTRVPGAHLPRGPPLPT